VKQRQIGAGNPLRQPHFKAEAYGNAEQSSPDTRQERTTGAVKRRVIWSLDRVLAVG